MFCIIKMLFAQHRSKCLCKRHTQLNTHHSPTVFSSMTLSPSQFHDARRVCLRCLARSETELFQRCGGRPGTNRFYCSHACQKADWPMHRPFCSATLNEVQTNELQRNICLRRAGGSHTLHNDHQYDNLVGTVYLINNDLDIRLQTISLFRRASA